LRIDLLDFFRGLRPWSQLYRFVDNLPPWGLYKSQLVMDEEWARMICDQEEAGQDHPPAEALPPDELMSPFGYTPVVGRLDLLLDRVQGVEAAVVWSVSRTRKGPESSRCLGLKPRLTESESGGP
jgi:hypothetical protein